MSDYNYILVGDKPVAEPDLMKWAKWFECADRIVERTQIGECMVSTVFLGTDQNFGSVGPPILWETMILGGPRDGEQERYSTLSAAKEGHARIVEECAELNGAAARLWRWMRMMVME